MDVGKHEKCWSNAFRGKKGTAVKHQILQKMYGYGNLPSEYVRKLTGSSVRREDDLETDTDTMPLTAADTSRLTFVCAC